MWAKNKGKRLQKTKIDEKQNMHDITSSRAREFWILKSGRRKTGAEDPKKAGNGRGRKSSPDN